MCWIAARQTGQPWYGQNGILRNVIILLFSIKKLGVRVLWGSFTEQTGRMLDGIFGSGVAYFGVLIMGPGGKGAVKRCLVPDGPWIYWRLKPLSPSHRDRLGLSFVLEVYRCSWEGTSSLYLETFLLWVSFHSCGIKEERS